MSALVGTAGSLVAILVGWQTLDFPVPAMVQDVEQLVGDHASDNTARFTLVEDKINKSYQLTLGLLLGNAEDRLDRIILQLEKDPNNPELRQRRRRTEREIADLQRDIGELIAGGPQ